MPIVAFPPAASTPRVGRRDGTRFAPSAAYRHIGLASARACGPVSRGPPGRWRRCRRDPVPSSGLGATIVSARQIPDVQWPLRALAAVAGRAFRSMPRSPLAAMCGASGWAVQYACTDGMGGATCPLCERPVRAERSPRHGASIRVLAEHAR
jgi:hypothetical protein